MPPPWRVRPGRRAVGRKLTVPPGRSRKAGSRRPRLRPRPTSRLAWLAQCGTDKVDYIWYDQEHSTMSPESLQVSRNAANPHHNFSARGGRQWWN